MLRKKLILLRKKIRSNEKEIIAGLIEGNQDNICFICGTSENLTKEHVIPKWAFENKPNSSFITGVNQISQAYSKTTIPACFECNSQILGSLEKHIKQNLDQLDYSEFDNQLLEYIILWLELIDYKFQFLNLRRKFLKSKNHTFIPYLADFPLDIIQSIEMSPSKIYSRVRKSLKKLSVKTKTPRINSLLTIKSTNKDFHFFHNTGEHIFIELPNQKKALFYFIESTFDDNSKCQQEAQKIIENTY